MLTLALEKIKAAASVEPYGHLQYVIMFSKYIYIYIALESPEVQVLIFICLTWWGKVGHLGQNLF